MGLSGLDWPAKESHAPELPRRGRVTRWRGDTQRIRGGETARGSGPSINRKIRQHERVCFSDTPAAVDAGA